MIFKSYILEDNLNKISKNIILFYGENLGLKNEFKDKIKRLNQNNEILSFNQEEIINNKSLIFNEINNISLFNKEKVYFIEEVNDKLFSLVEELNEITSNEKIYFFSDVLDKKSKIRNYFEKSEKLGAVACYADTELGIKKIITKKLSGFTGLTSQNINMIIESSGLNRAKVINEIEKIIIFFQDKVLETKKLENLLDIKVNEDFNLLKDQALMGNKLKTNKLLGDTVIDVEKINLYLNLINQRLKRFRELKRLDNTVLEKEIDNLKPPIFWKDKPNFISQARIWSKDKIHDILKKTYEFEIKLKSSSIINKEILFKKLILDVCVAANS